jgi:hypothetical protein
MASSLMEGVHARKDANKHMGKVTFLSRDRKEMKLEYGEGGETETIEAHPKVRFADFKPGDHVKLRIIDLYNALWEKMDPKDVAEGGDGVKKSALKRKVPSLNAELLLSERGLDEIRKTFPTIKFRGPGHEAKDLHKLIDCYKDFFNNFYPKFNFHRVVRKCESLGTKTEVKAYMNEARTDYKDQMKDDILRAEEEEDQAAREARGEGEDSDLDEDLEERIQKREKRAAKAPAAPSSAPRVVAAPAPVLTEEEKEEQKARAVASRAKAMAKLAERKRARERVEEEEQEAAMRQEQEAGLNKDEDEAFYDEMENLEELDHPALSSKRQKDDDDDHASEEITASELGLD